MADFKFDIEPDFREVEKMLKDVPAKIIPKAASTAINRTAKKVRTVARRDVAKRMGLKQKDVKASFKLQKSTQFTLTATITATGKPINLIKFVSPGRRNPNASRKKAGVKAKAWGKQKIYPGTFIGDAQTSGAPRVFKRTGAGRLPIKAVFGPSVPSVFVDDAVERGLRKKATEEFRKEFDRDLARRLAKL